MSSFPILQWNGTSECLPVMSAIFFSVDRKVSFGTKRSTAISCANKCISQFTRKFDWSFRGFDLQRMATLFDDYDIFLHNFLIEAKCHHDHRKNLKSNVQTYHRSTEIHLLSYCTQWKYGIQGTFQITYYLTNGIPIHSYLLSRDDSVSRLASVSKTAFSRSSNCSNKVFYTKHSENLW